MVKKSSLFSKLKNRWRSVQVEEEPVQRTGARTTVRGTGARPGTRPPMGTSRPSPGGGSPGPIGGARSKVEPTAAPAAKAERFDKARIQPLAAAGEPVDARSGRKLSQREEAMVTLGEGFKELCSLMRGVQVRIDAQGTRSDAQGEALTKLALQLEKQGSSQAALLSALGSLPDTMRDVKGALEKAAQTDARTAETLGEFRSTMERVQGSMTQMVEHSKKSADATSKLAEDQRHGSERVAKVIEERSKDGEAMRTVVQRMEKNSTDHMTALRLAQQDQSTRMHKLVSQSSSWNKAILAVLVMTFLALAGIFFVMLSGR